MTVVSRGRPQGEAWEAGAPTSKGCVRDLRAWAAMGGVTALAGLGAGRWLPLTTVPVLCPFRALTGFPCPTCGASRALAVLADGRFGEAFVLQPLITTTLLAAVLVLPVSLLPAGWVAAPTRFLAVRPVVFTRALVIALVSNWVYLLRMSVTPT